MGPEGDHDLGFGYPLTRAGYRWERRAEGLRLSIPLTPTWGPVLILGLLTLSATVVSLMLPFPGGPLDSLAVVSRVVLIYAGLMFVASFVGAVLGWCCPAWVRRSGDRFAITVEDDELVAEWPDGRVRRIPRDEVVGVAAQDTSSPEAEMAWWTVTVSVAVGVPLSLQGHSKRFAGWLAATLGRALRLPAASTEGRP